MGLGKFIRNMNDKKLTNNGFVTGKQARQMKDTTVYCAYHKCTTTPGGHKFKFPHAKDFCTKHASEIQASRNEAVAKRVAKKKQR